MQNNFSNTVVMKLDDQNLKNRMEQIVQAKETKYRSVIKRYTDKNR